MGEGQQKQQLQINKHLSICSRAKILKSLVDQRQGNRQSTQSQIEETCHMDSIRTKMETGWSSHRKTSSKTTSVMAHMFGLGHWYCSVSRALITHSPRITLLHQFHSLPPHQTPPDPPPWSPITRPESGYEASAFSGTE